MNHIDHNPQNKSELDNKIEEILKGIQKSENRNDDDGPGFYDGPDYEQFGEDNDMDQGRKEMDDYDEMQDDERIKVKTRTIGEQNGPEFQQKIEILGAGSPQKDLDYQDWEYGSHITENIFTDNRKVQNDMVNNKIEDMLQMAFQDENEEAFYDD